ncbi:hypothetical protein EV182_000281 [Spiromyces aspiralis]|uniref:Uncharacterized protein n=1 Tax=Spiromyces aspiralis TaxID=68401 RepID=A0ACC1HW67_9FUNG|nr:hypothetical protein EV182_000281 [Spiromyces aspiralis]
MAAVVSAHDHEHMDLSKSSDAEAAKSVKPLPDMHWSLLTHIILMLVAYAGIFPLALWAFSVVSFLGYLFGWFHKTTTSYTRPNSHVRLSWFLLVVLFLHAAAGSFLHIRRIALNVDFSRRARILFYAYNISCLAHALFGYIQLVLGVLVSWDVCMSGRHTGQCLSHFARGTALLFYGVLLFAILRLCGPVFKLLPRPIEFYQGLVFAGIGVFTIFTEHNFLSSSQDAIDYWSHKDLQHTFIGVLWIAGGLLGAYIGRSAKPHQRNIIPPLILIITGAAMGNHQQNTLMSTQIHSVFGWSLILTGISQIIEFFLLGSNIIDPKAGSPHTFQYVPPLFMALSGLYLMGGTTEQILRLIAAGIDYTTYCMFLAVIGFALLFLVSVLVDLFKKWAPESVTYYLNPNLYLALDAVQTTTLCRPSGGDGDAYRPSRLAPGLSSSDEFSIDLTIDDGGLKPLDTSFASQSPLYNESNPQTAIEPYSSSSSSSNKGKAVHTAGDGRHPDRESSSYDSAVTSSRNSDSGASQNTL